MDCEDGAAAGSASIVNRLTRVDTVIIKPGGAQLQVGAGVHKHASIVVPVAYLFVILIPAHAQRGRAGDLALQPEPLALLHKRSGRELQHKLRRFCKENTTFSLLLRDQDQMELQERRSELIDHVLLKGGDT